MRNDRRPIGAQACPPPGEAVLVLDNVTLYLFVRRAVRKLISHGARSFDLGPEAARLFLSQRAISGSPFIARIRTRPVSGGGACGGGLFGRSVNWTSRLSLRFGFSLSLSL